MWSWLKPLVAIVRKALNSAPQHLQHILLCLQRYNLEIRYKRGKEMFLADTLSRASHPTRKCPNLSMSWRRLIIRPYFLSVVPDGIKLPVHQQMTQSCKNCN